MRSGKQGQRGGAGAAKTTFRSIFVYKLISYIIFFKYTFFGFKPLQRRLCDEFEIQNRSPGKKKFKLTKSQPF